MFDTQEECLTFLENIRWQGRPHCPYCDSERSSLLKGENRYHCNDCFTSYSVTVGTLFHRTHVELPKWFRAIQAVMNEQDNMTVRQFASEIGVSKNTAEYMLIRIREAIVNEPKLVRQIYLAVNKPSQ